jgi:Mg-chelatase subunit ChlD
MNNEFPIDPRQALESSLTALLLGELPQDQERFLRQAIATDPELAKTYARLKQTIELVRETEANPQAESSVRPEPARMEERRRQQLLQRFKTVKPVEFKQPPRRQVSWLLPAAAAAVVTVLAAIATLLPIRSKSKLLAQRGERELVRQELLERLNGHAANGTATSTQRFADFDNKSVDEAAFRSRGYHPQPSTIPASTASSAPAESQAAGRSQSPIILPTESQPQAVTLSANSAPQEKRDQTFTFGLTPPAEAAPAQQQNLSWQKSASLDAFYAVPNELAAKEENAPQTATPAFGDAPIVGSALALNKKDENAAAPATPTTASGIGGGAIGGGALGAELPALSMVEPPKGAVTFYSGGSFGGYSVVTPAKQEGKLPETIHIQGVGDVPVLRNEISLVTNEATASSLADNLVNSRASSEELDAAKPAETQQSAIAVQGGRSAGDLDVKLAFREKESAKVVAQAGELAEHRSADSSALADQKVAGKPSENKPTLLLTQRSLSELEKAKEGKDNLGRAVDLYARVDDLKKQPSQPSPQRKSALQESGQIDQEDLAGAKPGTPPPVPQPEVLARENPFSTFSLNVSDVSFKLAAASLEKGVLPEAGSIRSEEFINAFDYRDPEPTGGAPVAFAWERARYPFGQNREVLRCSIKTAAAGRAAGQPLNLVLLLDNSGSMERADRVRILHEALRVLATQLTPQDTFSVVTFARTARLWVDGVRGDQAGRVADELSSLTPQGGTNLEEAMALAYQTAQRHYAPNGINRVVLLTDGAANLGDTNPEVLKRTVEANRQHGVALDCFGVGWEGYNDDLLETLTRNGDGRYGFLNTPEDAASGFAGQLAGALHVAASDVKVQVEFNPNRVNVYRQIGYARHQLTKEQFRDNTVDAAEIGAAESGNAVYVVESNPQGDGPLATVRVRYKIPGTSDHREHEWAVPYAGSATPLEQSTPAMRLAATASAFSEWLASSPYSAEVTPDRLLGCFNGVPATYGTDARPQKLEWMIHQAKALSGK